MQVWYGHDLRWRIRTLEGTSCTSGLSSASFASSAVIFFFHIDSLPRYARESLLNRSFCHWQAGPAPVGDNTHPMQDRRLCGGDFPAFFTILTGEKQ
jgi:hypothetical protein